MRRLLSLLLVILAVFPFVDVLSENVDIDAQSMVISGDGTSIIKSVSIPFTPARIIIDCLDRGAVFTLVGAEKDHVFRTVDVQGHIGLLDDNSEEFTLLIEAPYSWRFSAEPVGFSDTPGLKGTGDCLSPFFKLTEPIIINIACIKESTFGDEFRLCLNYYDTLTKNWKQTVVFEGKTSEIKRNGIDKIIRPAKGQDEYFWTIACEHLSEWEITTR